MLPAVTAPTPPMMNPGGSIWTAWSISPVNIQVVFDGKHYDLTYTSIETADVDSKEAILITIDTQNRIWLYDGTARVECKKLGKKMLFVGANGKDYRAIMEQLRIGTFRM